jgi:hypothetical protein
MSGLPSQWKCISTQKALDCKTLKREAILPSETSVNIYQSTRCNINEDLGLQEYYFLKS